MSETAISAPFSLALNEMTLSEQAVYFEKYLHIRILIKKSIFLTRELSLINTCCWRADHEILMHDGGAGVH